MGTTKSKLAQALEARGRFEKTLDMVEVLGSDLRDHDGTPLTKVCYRINNKREDDDSIVAAYAQLSRLAERAEGGKEDIKRDQDALNDAKFIQALWRACRNPDDPSEDLFVAPEWMKDNLDTDTIAGLLNGYNEVRAFKLGIPMQIDAAFVASIRNSCVAAADTEIPETVLCSFVREVLSKILIRMSVVWQEERTSAALLAQTALKALFEDELTPEARGKLRAACEGFLRAHSES